MLGKPAQLLQFVAASQRGFCIGQFARLLPTLVVVAVSQAPSPESNPDSPSPVVATVVHYTTVKADRSEVRVILQSLEEISQPQLLPFGTGPARADVPLGPVWFSFLSDYPLKGAGLPCNWLQSTKMTSMEMIHWYKPPALADCFKRVLATKFWRMSNWAAGAAAILTPSQR